MTKQKKTRLVVDISGGLIQAIYTNDPNADIQILFIDNQTEGTDKDDLIVIDGEEHYCAMEVPMLNRDHVYSVFAANNPEGFEYGVNVYPPLADGTLNPFEANFRTENEAEEAGKKYLSEHPETETFTVFVMEIADGQVVSDDTLYTVDRDGVI